ncbi:MAG TPA: hypothetical protein VHH09_08315 [Acidimicrobiales bacterium]|nr:hypothetical protein [Acidimicrobiales bacterium]
MTSAAEGDVGPGQPSPWSGLLDARAVAAGAGVGLVVAVPTIVITSIADVNVRSNAVFVPYLVYLAGLVAGGWRAGRLRPEAPLSNGGVAAIAAYAVLAVAGSVIRVASDRSLDVVSLASNAFLAASAGILGALIASWRRPARHASDPPVR